MSPIKRCLKNVIKNVVLNYVTLKEVAAPKFSRSASSQVTKLVCFMQVKI
jgi:hypothetical protein